MGLLRLSLSYFKKTKKHAHTVYSSMFEKCYSFGGLFNGMTLVLLLLHSLQICVTLPFCLKVCALHGKLDMYSLLFTNIINQRASKAEVNSQAKGDFYVTVT